MSRPDLKSGPPGSDSTGPPVKVVPRGLRSFDAGDADFFLDLLPGSRDRHGLPESLRFWKTRVESIDSEEAFPIGLIYGPSGCGKSSLVKAGLLPRLAGHVVPIYVEATSEETEVRLLKGLHRRCPDLSAGLGLAETMASLRRQLSAGSDRTSTGATAGKKVLIVLDQFEQWLHARRELQGTELAQALRQCDGQHVQCIIMVRDDFWLAVGRLLRELEVRLVVGENSALVDLFDVLHARKVLAELGRAFGRLPEKRADWTTDQEKFLDQAAGGLALEDKVVPVRLALFAEM